MTGEGGEAQRREKALTVTKTCGKRAAYLETLWH